MTDRHTKTFQSLMMLALESNRVVVLRWNARREAELMVNEKIDAAIKAARSAMTGASGDAIIRRYRRRVAANAKRVSGTSRTAGRRN